MLGGAVPHELASCLSGGGANALVWNMAFFSLTFSLN